jgi:hypothetical protein
MIRELRGDRLDEWMEKVEVDDLRWDRGQSRGTSTG